MISEHRFVNPVPPSPRPPYDAALLFRCVRKVPEGVDWAGAEVVDEQGQRADGVPQFVFARLRGWDVIRIPGAVDYYLSDDEITCHLVDDRHAYLVEIALLGLVMALWLERRGTPTLHASVAVVGGVAVAFLGSSGGGKTSTMAGCLARGHALLSDDLLAVRPEGGGFVGERGYPALRLWPDQADRFLGHHEGLPVLHPDFDKRRVLVGAEGFGVFADGPARLHRFYLPERIEDSSGAIEIKRLRTDEAFMTLARHSFLPREVQRFGWQAQRLAILSRLVGAVPVVRLRYPSGFHLLSGALEQVEQDVRSDGAPIS